MSDQNERRAPSTAQEQSVYDLMERSGYDPVLQTIREWQPAPEQVRQRAADEVALEALDRAYAARRAKRCSSSSS